MISSERIGGVRLAQSAMSPAFGLVGYCYLASGWEWWDVAQRVEMHRRASGQG
jgi:hypothetical protein